MSRDTISNITDAVLDEVTAWQARPLDAVWPVMFFDALVVKVREGNMVTNKAAHIAIGGRHCTQLARRWCEGPQRV